MKTKEPKVFTLQEARGTLPYVKQIVADIVETQNKLDSLTNKENDPTYQELQQEIKEYQKELAAVGC